MRIYYAWDVLRKCCKGKFVKFYYKWILSKVRILHSYLVHIKKQKINANDETSEVCARSNTVFNRVN